jgi:hypothetical protein
MDFSTLASASLLFLGGMLAKPISELVNYATIGWITRNSQKRDAVKGRTLGAAEEALKSLASLERHMNTLSNLARRAEISKEDLAAATSGVDNSIADLEAHIALLPLEFRKKVSLVVEILRNVNHIRYEAGNPVCHYSSRFAIVRTTMAHGRELLAAYLRQEPPPPPNQSILEYKKAWENIQSFYDSELYVDELLEEEERAEKWRKDNDFQKT